MYDPRTGRFTQIDPIDENRPHKHYAYAGNNPLVKKDPWGLDEADWEAAKKYLLNKDLVIANGDKGLKPVLKKMVDGEERNVLTEGGQKFMNKYFWSYYAALKAGDSVSAYYRLRDLQVGYLEGVDVLQNIEADKFKLAQYVLMVQIQAMAMNLQAIGAAQSLNKVINEFNTGNGKPTGSRAKPISKGKTAAEVIKEAEEQYKKWVESLQQKKTPTSTVAGAYEAAHTGPVNYLLKGGGAEFWADGIEGNVILEAKCVTDAARSPFIKGSNIPAFLRDKIVGEVEDEFRRMAKIIKDSNNPLKSVRVITNNTEAKTFFEELMKRLEIVGEVVMRP